MKKKYGILTIIPLVILIGMFFCLKEDDNTSVNGPQADWVDHYSNFNTMVNSADLIIKGIKIDSYTEQRVDLIFTKQIIEINKLYKGDRSVGDKIEILQTGGSLNNTTTQPFIEAPLLDNNGIYLLFLDKTSEGHYLILGGYQGVGKIKDDKAIFNEANVEISKELKDKEFKDIEKMLDYK